MRKLWLIVPAAIIVLVATQIYLFCNSSSSTQDWTSTTISNKTKSAPHQDNNCSSVVTPPPGSEIHFSTDSVGVHYKSWKELQQHLSTGSHIGPQCKSKNSFWMDQLREESFQDNRKASEDVGKSERLVLMDNIGDSNRSFAICTIPKVGCSRWRRLLRKGKGIKNWNGYPHSWDTNGLDTFSELQQQNATRAKLAVRDPRRIRILMVRNPFARILSAWLQKKDSFNLPKTFDKFVLKETNRAGPPNEHWRRISEFCGARHIQFDFIGKVEDVDLWGNELIRRIGLYEASQSGWGESNGTFLGSGKSVGSTTTNANQKLLQYYTPQLVEKVKTYYYEDILRFGYYEDYLELRALVDTQALSAGKTINGTQS